MILIEATHTVREIIKRFDVVYPNTLTFLDKLKFLYGFEKSVFLTTYLIEKPDITVENFADSEPVASPQAYDIYFKSLLVHYYIRSNDFEAAGQAIAVLSEAIGKIENHIEHQLFEPLSEGG